ncbi:hypothetical protein H5J25_15445 [Sphingomonas aliaeris]|uniref:DUF11 domain-containing protein n=1 Tax=Sphingomonas aliaeris TaxID=2759526 RepID=A0A974NTR5_9SPHN|nr:hypothetical protein [Sphingomonas aliaeris]QQV76786.1 hypothetical protein H5J25_15445 [Sphingomonas aliaeris]
MTPLSLRMILALIAALVMTTPAIAADLNVDKTSTIVGDQVNTLTPARNLPGATIDYSLVATNPLLNLVTIRHVVIEDVIPATVKFRVLPYGSGSTAVEFTNGTLLGLQLLSSGLTYGSIEYSDGVTWTYLPQDDGTGYDGKVRGIRVTMSNGIMTTGGAFRLRYRVMLR